MISFLVGLSLSAILVAKADDSNSCAPGYSYVQIQDPPTQEAGCSKLDKDGNSVRFGTWTTRNMNGQIMAQKAYNTQGQLEGQQLTYSLATGKLEDAAFYLGGKQLGPMVRWDADGAKQSAENIVRGNESYIFERKWDANGQLISETCKVVDLTDLKSNNSVPLPASSVDECRNYSALNDCPSYSKVCNFSGDPFIFDGPAKGTVAGSAIAAGGPGAPAKESK